MGFMNPSGAGSNPSPATKRYTWRGGEHLADGKYRFSYYDKEKGEDVEAKLPFELWWLDNTWSITGGGEGYYYWTNEIAPAGKTTPGSIMSLHKTVFDSDGNRSSEVLARGTYDQVRKAVGSPDKNGKYRLPSDMKFTNNYYFLNPETKEIEMVQMKGSSFQAFMDFSKANRDYDQKKGRIVLNEELKKNGAVYYYEPKYEVAGEYTDKERELMQESWNKVNEYIQALYGKDAQNVGEDGGIDQSPVQYEGDQSQETADDDVNQEVNLNDVPFI